MYQPRFEQFKAGVGGPTPRMIQFQRALVFPAGDRMELFLFSDGEELLVVGLSGSGLEELTVELGHVPSREEKVDLAGLFLKEKIDAGEPLVPEELTMRAGDLKQIARKLGLLPS